MRRSAWDIEQNIYMCDLCLPCCVPVTGRLFLCLTISRTKIFNASVLLSLHLFIHFLFIFWAVFVHFMCWPGLISLWSSAWPSPACSSGFTLPLFWEGIQFEKAEEFYGTEVCQFVAFCHKNVTFRDAITGGFMSDHISCVWKDNSHLLVTLWAKLVLSTQQKRIEANKSYQNWECHETLVIHK